MEDKNEKKKARLAYLLKNVTSIYYKASVKFLYSQLVISSSHVIVK